MTLSIAAASRTLSVIGPAVSWLWLIGTMKVRLTRPTVGLKPTMPFSPAGQVIEPSVSVPTVSAARLAAIAAPLPADDPQVLRSSAQGFFVSPPTALHPLVALLDRLFAHSERLALPRITAPALRSSATIGAPRFVPLTFSARRPAAVGPAPEQGKRER